MITSPMQSAISRSLLRHIPLFCKAKQSTSSERLMGKIPAQRGD